MSRLAFRHVHGPRVVSRLYWPRPRLYWPKARPCMPSVAELSSAQMLCVHVWYARDLHVFACLWISAASITSCQWLFGGAQLPSQSMQAVVLA